MSGQRVMLRHRRTEQTVIVTLATYQRQWRRRYRNWRLARGNLLPRPCLTLSECLLSECLLSESLPSTLWRQEP